MDRTDDDFVANGHRDPFSQPDDHGNADRYRNHHADVHTERDGQAELDDDRRGHGDKHADGHDGADDNCLAKCHEHAFSLPDGYGNADRFTLGLANSDQRPLRAVAAGVSMEGVHLFVRRRSRIVSWVVPAGRGMNCQIVARSAHMKAYLEQP